MDGQQNSGQQNFYLDNLNLDTNEMSWGREQKPTLKTSAPEQNTWNTTPEHDPRALGGRVSAFPDSAFSASTSPSAEAVPRTENLQPEILAPAPNIPQESLNPALVTPRADEPAPTLVSAPNPASTSKAHASAEEFARNAEVELAQDGNIAGFYDKIRDYGDIK